MTLNYKQYYTTLCIVYFIDLFLRLYTQKSIIYYRISLTSLICLASVTSFCCIQSLPWQAVVEVTGCGCSNRPLYL